MLLNDRLWPFLPSEKRTDDQEEAWWRECYLPGTVESVLENSSGWNLVVNRGGDGASTILKAFQRRVGSRALCVNYDPRDWPVDQDVDAGWHLVNLLELSSQALRTYFKNDPSKLTLLSISQKEFLRWIIQKYNDRRAYPRWLDSLTSQYAELMRQVDYEDDYYTPQEDSKQAGGAIEELGNLVQRISFDQIVFILDVPYFMTESMQKQVATLFEWLTIMEHPAVRVVGTAPASFIHQFNLIENTRDRLNFTFIPIDLEHIRQIQQRYLTYATQGQVNQLNQIASPDLLRELDLGIAAEYTGTGLAGWVSLLKVLCEMSGNDSKVLDLNSLGSICRDFYQKSIALWIDHEKKNVWRGYKLIKLDDAPLDFLLRLWHARGKPIDNFGFGITQSNKYKLANRVRAAIEPCPGEPIYLKNERNLGYWLENARFV